jgi:hypothetical protein
MDKKELLTLAPGDACRWEKLKLMKIWWVRTSRANHKSMWQHFGVLKVRRQKASARPSAYTCRGGLVPIQHQSCDMETDGQCTTRDGSSARPGTLLENSYFRWIAVRNILWHYLQSGEDD